MTSTLGPAAFHVSALATVRSGEPSVLGRKPQENPLALPLTATRTQRDRLLQLIEKSRTGNVLNFALNMFEATVALGEVFGLQSIDRTTAKVTVMDPTSHSRVQSS